MLINAFVIFHRFVTMSLLIQAAQLSAPNEKTRRTARALINKQQRSFVNLKRKYHVTRSRATRAACARAVGSLVNVERVDQNRLLAAVATVLDNYTAVCLRTAICPRPMRLTPLIWTNIGRRRYDADLSL